MHKQMFLPRIVVIYVLALLGGTFYASRFPESTFPGKYMYIHVKAPPTRDVAVYNPSALGRYAPSL